jgi:tyrosyl-tRNA synthetase
MIVAQYHSQGAAEGAAAEFDRVFSARETPAEMPEIALPAGCVGIVDLIVSAGFSKSRSAARRLVAQNAVSINGQKIDQLEAVVDLRDGQVLRVGKRRFGRIKLN